MNFSLANSREILQAPETAVPSSITKDTGLDEEVRTVFEPRYGRKLSDREVWEIRFNLKNFVLTLLEINKLRRPK